MGKETDAQHCLAESDRVDQLFSSAVVFEDFTLHLAIVCTGARYGGLVAGVPGTIQ